MLRPQPIGPVPHETARVARAVFRTGHPYLRVADELDAFVTDDDFASLFPAHGQPALAPWRLALVSILQFAERLSDLQAPHRRAHPCLGRDTALPLCRPVEGVMQRKLP